MGEQFARSHQSSTIKKVFELKGDKTVIIEIHKAKVCLDRVFFLPVS
jgi:hypothetical protein